MSQKKIKLLAWSDCAFAPTGFGTVSKHVLKTLHDTGKFEIDHLAINYYGEFYDTNKYPYQIVPARLLVPADPFGNQMLIRNLQKKDYDILWILNDTFVVNKIAPELEKLRIAKAKAGKKSFKIIYYYPVDCSVTPGTSKIINVADAAVCITKFGADKTTEKIEDLNKDIDIIYHGCNNQDFKTENPKAVDAWRAKYLAVKDKSTYVIINVNRNSIRKDMARGILAFKHFKEEVPNSIMYMHCASSDNNIDLTQAVEALGMSTKKDVLFPSNFELHKGGFPIKALNFFYNSADLFFSTTLGEGWGLTTTEAMAAGTPVLLPNNTSAPEILSDNRGYMYDCEDLTWIDNQDYRPVGRLGTIVDSLIKCHTEWNTPAQKAIIRNAKNWAQEYSWENVNKEWLYLFQRVLNEKTKYVKRIEEV